MTFDRPIICFCISLAFSAFALISQAEELKAKVTLDVSKIENSTQRETLESLGNRIEEYLNTTKFTSLQFTPDEKIECRFTFIADSYSDDVFKGTLQVQSLRPVYDTNYNSTLLDYKDNNVEFDYTVNDPIIFNENSVSSQLAAILDFYVNIIIGIDSDSYSARGGDEYFNNARRIVQQSIGRPGWNATDNARTRGAFLKAFAEAPSSMLRDVVYNYYRNGMDLMVTAPDRGRNALLDTLKKMKELYTVMPSSLSLTIYRDSWLSELVNVFAADNTKQRSQVYDILNELYPTDTRETKRLVNGSSK